MDRDYALFAAVVDAGSLSAAGRRLGISSAMVSKRIAGLEARLGARLLHRTTRSLALTPIGRAFHVDVLAILAAVSAAEQRVGREDRRVVGTLRVTAPTSFGRLHIAPYLGRFIAAHPLVALRFDLSDEFVDLVAAGCDLAIRIAPRIGPGLAGHRLATSPRLLCASPEHLRVHGAPATPDDLRHFRLLAANGQFPWRLDGPDGPVSIDGASFVPTNSSEVVRELTLAGVGIALRSLWDVGRDIAEGRLQRVLPAYRGSAEIGIYAVYPQTPAVPAKVAAFIAFLEALHRAPSWGAMEPEPLTAGSSLATSA